MCRGACVGAVAAVEVSESAIVRVARVKRGRVVNRPRKDSVIRERALRGGPGRRGSAGYDCALTQPRGLWSSLLPLHLSEDVAISARDQSLGLGAEGGE